jgi:phospholipid/cholesterol/gamma-HCH transport system substrate-binding protein
MKKDNKNKISLGVFVTSALVLLILGIYIIGRQQKLFSDTFRLTAVFENVSGLQVGNNVRFSGINVGVIDNIEQVSDTTVKVDMMIKESIRKHIKKNAKASIGSDGLMGSKLLLISNTEPGAAGVEPGDYISAIKPVSMDDILGKLQITVDNAADITEDFSEVMDNILSGQGTVGKLLMDSSFANNIDQTVQNLNTGTKDFKQNMEAAKKSFLLRRLLKKKDRDDKKKDKDDKKKDKD